MLGLLGGNGGSQPKRFASDVTLAEAVSSLLLAKRLSNCRPRYIESLRIYLTQFARGRESSPISTFDVFAVEGWFGGRTEGLSTRASNIGRLSSLFAFCERRGWMDRNPCRQLERVRIDPKPPRILTVDQAAYLMRSVRGHPCLAFFTLALFAGVRPEELEKVTWECIDLAAGTLRIDASASKVRRRRIVHLEPNAVAWLKVAQESGAVLPMKRITRRRSLRAACPLLGFKTWPQDILRHSAASYLISATNDLARVAIELGNSPNILLRHYRELVSKENAVAFWSIVP